jgi:hypothetical protein
MGIFSDTRWQLTLTRLGILAFKIAIIVILILAVVTPLTGGVKVNAPELSNGVWTFDNGTLKLGSTVGVYNGGIFDVNDFYVVFGMTDSNSTSLGNFTTDHTNIRSGQWGNLPLHLTIDLNKMNESTLRSFVFNTTRVNTALEIGATYPLGWASGNLGGSSYSDWQPLITDYNVSLNSARLNNNGGQYTLTIPYHVNVSSKITGAPLDLKVTMSNDSGVMAMTDQQIVLQPQTKGELALNISSQTAQYLATHSELLHFQVQTGFMSVSATKSIDYQWKAIL